MQPENELAIKRDRHYTNIRRDARQKKLTQMRRQAYFQTVPISNVAQGFGLAPKEEGDYTIMEIFRQVKGSLINVQYSMNSMQQEDDQNVPQISLEAHINFWAFLLQEMFTDRLQMNIELEEFFIDFMKANPYKIIAMSVLLQAKVTNTLQIAMLPTTTTQILKQTALDWVKGTRGLTLIYNSLLNKFLSPRQYENVYEVIKQSLSLATFEAVTDCCHILKVILNYADYQQTQSIYTDESDLMVYLLKAIEPFIEQNNVAQLADAVISLTDTYEDLILDYARTGTALLGTRMIISQRNQNIEKGLEIIKHVSEIQKYQAITFLLEDRELNEAGLWKTIFNTNDILQSRNISIRREGFAILSNIMANGNESNLVCLMAKVEESCRNNLFDLIASSFKIDEDPTILKCQLIMISIFLYFSSRQDNEDREFMVNFIHETQILNLIEQLTRHTNTELAESATQLYENIKYFLNEQEQ